MLAQKNTHPGWWNGDKMMKTGTKIALVAAVIAAVTARYWF
tara:strand:- start:48 stop:170 length:123 start_codon:yes stop_codon:yes gene_type:complete